MSVTTRRAKARKRKARGPDGSVRGVGEEVATEVLEALVAELLSVEPERRRIEAAQLLRSRWSFEENLVDGFLWALARMPGVSAGRAGELFFDPDVQAYAKYRGWRIALGRADLADASTLLWALRDVKDEHLTENLRRMRQRLRKAAEPLLGSTH